MFVRSVAVALVLATTLACFGPPERERHQAEGAIAAARAAGAATYAPEELKSAEAALEKYDAAVAQRDYRQALRLAVEARDTADQATRRAGDEKAATQKRAEQLLADLTQLVDAGRTRLAGARGAATSAARLRSSIATADTALQEARASLEQQDYRGVIETLTPLVESLRAQVQPAPDPPSRRNQQPGS